MKPQFIIIAILITLKVIGVASRANAESYYEANKVSLSYSACKTEPKFQYINTFNNPTYRCGQTPKLLRI